MKPVAIAATATLGPYRAGEAPAEEPLATPRARKMMSRSAYLAARCLADLLRDVDPARELDRTAVGYFLGVGGSAGSLDDVTALLDASLVDGAFSLPAFGNRGLAACNPLLAFQLMNNFTMCHGAILEGLGGPNGALFSRGAGTVTAFAEALHAVASGESPLAIAGGADAATHPVTLAELGRDKLLARGLVPADGAALVALRPAGDGDKIVIEAAATASGRARVIGDAVMDAFGRALHSAGGPKKIDLVVLAPWGPPAADTLRSFVAARMAECTVIDLSAHGETLAASAAFAVVATVSALRGTAAPRRALVITLGVDGDPGVILVTRGAA